MLDRVVRYLRSRDVTFKLVSEAAPEPRPAVTPPRLARHGQLVATHIVLLDGVPAIACVRDGDEIDLAALAAETHATVALGTSADLPAPYTDCGEPVPPFGHELHVPVIADEALSGSSVIAFRAFAATDWIELAWDDYARIEQPRLASFASAGELPPHGEKRVA